MVLISSSVSLKRKRVIPAIGNLILDGGALPLIKVFFINFNNKVIKDLALLFKNSLIVKYFSQPLSASIYRKKTERIKDNLDQMFSVCCGHHVLLSSCNRTQGVIFPVSVLHQDKCRSSRKVTLEAGLMGGGILSLCEELCLIHGR